jgi:hypothetical protein
MPRYLKTPVLEAVPGQLRWSTAGFGYTLCESGTGVNFMPHMGDIVRCAPLCVRLDVDHHKVVEMIAAASEWAPLPRP